MYSASPCTVRVYIPPDCCVLAQGPKGLKNERNRNTTSAGSSRTFNHTRLLEVISRTSTLASAFPSCISRPPWLARCLAPALLAFALLPPLRRYFDVSHKKDFLRRTVAPSRRTTSVRTSPPLLLQQLGEWLYVFIAVTAMPSAVIIETLFTNTFCCEGVGHDQRSPHIQTCTSFVLPLKVLQLSLAHPAPMFRKRKDTDDRRQPFAWRRGLAKDLPNFIVIVINARKNLAHYSERSTCS